MNKFSTAVSLAAFGLILSSCGMFDVEDPYVGGDFAKLVQKEQEWSDTIKVVDNRGIEDTYRERIYSHKPEYFEFEASGASRIPTENASTATSPSILNSRHQAASTKSISICVSNAMEMAAR